MRVELVPDGCLFCLEAFFHFKAEEANLHPRRPQDVKGFILPVACCVALMIVSRRIVDGSGLFSCLNWLIRFNQGLRAEWFPHISFLYSHVFRSI